MLHTHRETRALRTKLALCMGGEGLIAYYILKLKRGSGGVTYITPMPARICTTLATCRTSLSPRACAAALALPKLLLLARADGLRERVYLCRRQHRVQCAEQPPGAAVAMCGSVSFIVFYTLNRTARVEKSACASCVRSGLTRIVTTTSHEAGRRSPAG